MKSSRRAKRQDDVRKEIKDAAVGLMVENGAAAISLGAIGRELGVTTASLYHYFDDRGALITALINDAAASLRRYLELALDSVAPDEVIGRIRTICIAWRRWSVSNSEQYLLLVDHRTMGYEIDPAAIAPEIDALLELLLDAVASAVTAGSIGLAAWDLELPADQQERLHEIVPRGDQYDAEVIYLTALTWSFLHGLSILDRTLRHLRFGDIWVEAAIRNEIERYISTITEDGGDQ